MGCLLFILLHISPKDKSVNTSQTVMKVIFHHVSCMLEYLLNAE